MVIMVNLGCFDDWEDVLLINGNDGDYFNYTNETDPDNKKGIYYWNIRLTNQKGIIEPDWTYLKVYPDKPYRDDILAEILGAVNVQKVDGRDVWTAIIKTTDRELDRYYKKGLIRIVSYLDLKSISELPKHCDDLIYEANISWSAGLLYNYKTYDYTAKSFNQQNERYVPLGDKFIAGAKEVLHPISKNKDKNDINRSGALANINGLIR